MEISRLQSPRICNGCSNVAIYEIKASIHNMLLCPDCIRALKNGINLVAEEDVKWVAEEHMQEVSHD